ncbi:MATE family efflux transporter [Flexithrix dorotheae]|uniref:MATE family efflux transporter n=1 Tax=Flexithrix dorotheae TaxID=70993 RepID=UPI00037F715F|nr:MATE family efflux transporter [Flexithrix dorotheae]
MNKKILKLAIPNILSNLTIPLLSSVDTALVGHLDGLHYLGAIAVGGMIFNFIYWGFGFLRMGTTGLTAQAFGNDDKANISLVFTRAILLAMLISFILIVLQKPISLLAFYLIKASPEVEVFAQSYYNIRIWAAPATLMLYAIHGWFLGMQNAKYPLILAIAVNLGNIGFSVFFVKVLHLNSDGVALGTVCAQYMGLVLGFFLLLKKYRASFKKLIFSQIVKGDELKRFLSLNSDIFIRTLCLVFVFTYFTAESAKFGDEILAVNTILMQFWTILAYGIDGFAFAAESLVGLYIGKKEQANMRQVIKLLFLWTIGLGLAIALVYWQFDEALLSLFTDKTGIIVLAGQFIIWTILAPLVNGFCFIWDGIFLGATDTKSLRNSMLICTFLVFLPIYHFTASDLGNNSLWIAMFVFMISRGITLSFIAWKQIPKWT